MKRGWLITLGLALILIIGFVVFTMFPGVINAPTLHGPSGSASSPAPATTTQAVGASLDDLIVVTTPLPNTTVTSPLVIMGNARGNWYFEATAPVVLKDSSGTVIAHGTLRAQGNWTTTDYVPFTATLAFTSPATHLGTLVLENDNPSGDPAKQKELDIPVQF